MSNNTPNMVRIANGLYLNTDGIPSRAQWSCQGHTSGSIEGLVTTIESRGYFSKAKTPVPFAGVNLCIDHESPRVTSNMIVSAIRMSMPSIDGAAENAVGAVRSVLNQYGWLPCEETLSGLVAVAKMAIFASLGESPRAKGKTAAEMVLSEMISHEPSAPWFNAKFDDLASIRLWYDGDHSIVVAGEKQRLGIMLGRKTYTPLHGLELEDRMKIVTAYSLAGRFSPEKLARAVTEDYIGFDMYHAAFVCDAEPNFSYTEILPEAILPVSIN